METKHSMSGKVLGIIESKTSKNSGSQPKSVFDVLYTNEPIIMFGGIPLRRWC